MGLDIIKDSLNIRRDTGYIPSEVNYYADLTVLQLLRYSASFYGRGAGSRITALADRFDLNLNRRIEELSYGNKRKVAIVQALIHSPRLLVLDEPTSGLDPLMQNEFFEVLKEENRRATIFFSSHVLYEVQRMCNKIAIIKQGEILKVESVDSLRKSTFKTVSIEYENINEPVLQMQGLVPAGQSGHLQKFLFNGDIKKLLYELSQKDIKNVLIEEPSLEEIFMHYYEREVE
jgi:ABC-2 type transport system ATP-binding protein